VPDIPDEAVEAAAEALAELDGDTWNPDHWPATTSYWRDRARAALTAAYPHLMRAIKVQNEQHVLDLDKIDKAEAENARLRAQVEAVREQRDYLLCEMQNMAMQHPQWSGQRVTRSENRQQLLDRAFYTHKQASAALSDEGNPDE
jgi:hypothetical protein